jgi:hypothetical protein
VLSADRHDLLICIAKSVGFERPWHSNLIYAVSLTGINPLSCKRTKLNETRPASTTAFDAVSTCSNPLRSITQRGVFDNGCCWKGRREQQNERCRSSAYAGKNHKDTHVRFLRFLAA